MFAAVFPGQGSQKPGMGQGLYEQGGPARAAFDEISAATGIDLARLCFESDEETLRRTENAQIALYTCGVAAWKELEPHLGTLAPQAMAGHSVGEYAALACAGVVSVSDGARLVQRRGEIMAASGKERPGSMAAVLGLESGELEAVCSETSTSGSVVVIANDNCPGQLVVSGDAAAVGRAGELAIARGAKRVLPLNVSGAFHSPLMDKSAVQMADALAAADFRQSSVPVVSNVTAEAVMTPSLWPDLLERQLRSTVRWTESVRSMLGMGIAVFVECGSGEVLSGLLRRIEREATPLTVNDKESIEATINALTEQKAGAA
ncbi:MAG: ACP S-malonyltransferase [Fimbriimonadaceae bacterium]